MLRAACFGAALAITSAASAQAPLSADAKRSFDAYQLLASHRVFMLSAEGKA
jgi:hypothetical protein